jgi:hypothetical protein
LQPHVYLECYGYFSRHIFFGWIQNNGKPDLFTHVIALHFAVNNGAFASFGVGIIGANAVTALVVMTVMVMVMVMAMLMVIAMVTVMVMVMVMMSRRRI